MIEVRDATADEMILAFLQAEIDSLTERGEWFANALAHAGADKAQLIDRADLTDALQNTVRSSLLATVRGYGRNNLLFLGFPGDTGWRLVTVTVAELGRLKYANHTVWTLLSGVTHLVADGVKNLDLTEGRVVRDNVIGVATRVRRGVRFPALIAVQCAVAAEMVLIEGHTCEPAI